MQIIYRADDGTDFRSEEECEAYENKKKIAAMNLQSRFFDNCGYLMDITDLYNCIENGWYMEIATSQEATFIAEYAEREVGIILFEDKPQVGRFYYTENEEWRPIEDLYQRYAKVNNIFERED
jgi:hypothetical protein